MKSEELEATWEGSIWYGDVPRVPPRFVRDCLKCHWPIVISPANETEETHFHIEKHIYPRRCINRTLNSRIEEKLNRN